MDIEHLQTVCLPIGFLKVGGQPLAAALTAHPNIVMGNRLQSLKNWWNKDNPLSTDVFLSEILEMNRKIYADKADYSNKNKCYVIPDQWQGSIENMIVIGDCSSDTNTKILAKKNCEVMGIFLNSVRLPSKFLFLVRNPYDIVSSRTLASYWKKSRTEILKIMVSKFMDNCKIGESLLARIKSMSQQHADVFIWHLEEHIANPQQKLKELCDFLGVESSASYLDACAKIFYKKPNQSRYLIDWPEASKTQIATAIKQYEFLSDYGWDS